MVPLVVLTELEAKRNHPELGWAARQALRALEDMRTGHGTLVRPLAGQRAGRHAAGRGQPPGAGRAAGGAPLRRQRPPHPRRRPQPGQRGRRRRAGHQGPAAAAEGQHRRARGRRVPQRAGRRHAAGRLRRAGRRRRASSTSCSSERVIDLGASTRARPPLPHGPRAPRRLAVGARPGPPRQARPPRPRATPRCSTSAADRPSSASPSTSSPTRTSASSASAATPARARASSRSPPGSRPCSRPARTSGSSCSGRSTPSAARTSGSSRAPRPRRWARGRPPSSMPSSP